MLRRLLRRLGTGGIASAIVLTVVVLGAFAWVLASQVGTGSLGTVSANEVVLTGGGVDGASNGSCDITGSITAHAYHLAVVGAQPGFTCDVLLNVHALATNGGNSYIGLTSVGGVGGAQLQILSQPQCGLVMGPDAENAVHYRLAANDAALLPGQSGVAFTVTTAVTDVIPSCVP